MMGDFNVSKRFRDESDEIGSDLDSPEVKRLRENLLGGLDDETEFGDSNLDLDSFMKSFEKEIVASAGGDEKSELPDLTSESGESGPDLGYLFEASDDDLGLPPTVSSPVVLQALELDGGSWEFEEEVPGYDSYGFGLVQTDSVNGGNGEYVAIDGLFDYSDFGFGSGDFNWRPETLPAQ